VIEGGGSRAAYASGAVDGLAQGGLRVDAVYGTSAGGAAAAWFAAGQTADGCRTWSYAADPRLVSVRRWVLRRGPIWDLDRLYQHVYVHDVPLDVAAVRRAPFPVWVTCTDADTGATAYYDLRRGDVLRLLQATSAVPLVAGEPVSVNGRRLVDGGVTDPIPIGRALADGADDIVLVLNRPAKHAHAPENRFALGVLARRYPALADAARRRHLVHRASIARAERPPSGVRVSIVRPRVDTGLGRFTREPGPLERAIARGRQDGRAAAARLTARAPRVAAASPKKRAVPGN
jgi:predicted patatin/cPLA2 family phospholipase